MRRLILPLTLMCGIALLAVIAVGVSRPREEATFLLPTLSLGPLRYGDNGLLGQATTVPLHVFSATQGQAGVVLPASEHNIVSCPSDYNTPLISNNSPAPATTRMWGYKYSGNERANDAAHKTGRQLFDGEFYISAGELAHVSQANRPLYDPINTFTTVTGNRDYYFMSEVDACFRCGQGLQVATACPGYVASSSSSIASSSSSSQVSSSSASSSSASSASSVSSSSSLASSSSSSSTVSSSSASSSSSSSAMSSSSSSSAAPLCGNGVLNGNEQCDDGNTNDADGCFSNCTSMVPPSHLSLGAYWSFDAGTNDLADRIGSLPTQAMNDLVWSGARPAGVPGNSYSLYSLNGKTNYAYVQNPTSAVRWNAVDPLTIGSWVLPLGTSMGIVSMPPSSSGSTSGYEIFINEQRRVAVTMRIAGLSLHAMTTTALPNDGSFHHVLFSYDPAPASVSQRVKVFIDGVQATMTSPSTGSGLTLVPGTAQFRILYSSILPASVPQGGYIDDVRIMRGVIGPAQIPGITSPSSSSSQTSSLVSSSSSASLTGTGTLIAHWTFDGGNGDVVDRSGNVTGNTITTLQWVGTVLPPIPGNAYALRSTSQDSGASFATISSQHNFGTGASFSIAMWLRASPPTYDMTLLSKIDMSGRGYELRLGTGNIPYLMVQAGPSANFILTGATGIPNDGQFHRLVVTVDPTQAQNNRVHMAIDGTAVGLSLTDAPLWGSLITPAPLRLLTGTLPTSTIVQDVSIDDVRIYRGVITP